MTKRVVDLTPEELDRLADEAWSTAAQEALAKGFPVTGSRNGRRYRHHPDGTVEDLGPVAAIPSNGPKIETTDSSAKKAFELIASQKNPLRKAN